MKKIFLPIAIFFFSFISFSYALETPTHKAINEYAAQNTFNGFSLNSYLHDQLGLQKGVNEVFNSKYGRNKGSGLAISYFL